jgi:hypothetical protein
MTVQFCIGLVLGDLLMCGIDHLFRTKQPWWFVTARDVITLIVFTVAGWWLKCS